MCVQVLCISVYEMRRIIKLQGLYETRNILAGCMVKNLIKNPFAAFEINQFCYHAVCARHRIVSHIFTRQFDTATV